MVGSVVPEFEKLGNTAIQSNECFSNGKKTNRSHHVLIIVRIQCLASTMIAEM